MKNNNLNPFYWLHNLQLKLIAFRKLSSDNLELLKRVCLDETNKRKVNNYRVSFKGMSNNDLITYQRLRNIISPLNDKKLNWTLTSVIDELKKRYLKEKENG